MLQFLARRTGMVTRAEHLATLVKEIDQFNLELRAVWGELERERSKAIELRRICAENENFIGEMFRTQSLPKWRRR